MIENYTIIDNRDLFQLLITATSKDNFILVQLTIFINEEDFFTNFRLREILSNSIILYIISEMAHA